MSAFEVVPDFCGVRDEYTAMAELDAGFFTAAPTASPAGVVSLLVPRLAVETVRLLRAQAVDVVWFSNYWDYPVIEEVIAHCDALLAVTDRYYFSSTGKAIELCYATGHRAYSREPISPLPVFVLPVDESHARYRHLETPGTWTILEPSAREAARRIIAAMRGAD